MATAKKTAEPKPQTDRQKARVADTIRRMPESIGREDPALIAAMTPKK